MTKPDNLILYNKVKKQAETVYKKPSADTISEIIEQGYKYKQHDELARFQIRYSLPLLLLSSRN